MNYRYPAETQHGLWTPLVKCIEEKSGTTRLLFDPGPILFFGSVAGKRPCHALFVPHGFLIDFMVAPVRTARTAYAYRLDLHPKWMVSRGHTGHLDL